MREGWWNYPRHLEGSLFLLKDAVVKFRPYSLFSIVTAVIVLIFFTLGSFFPFIKESVVASGSNFLVEGVVSPPAVVDPLPTTSIPAADTQLKRDLNNLIFDSLLKIDKDGRVIPKIASNVTMLDNARTISVNVRRDVFWQDGEPLTYEDILFTFDIIKEIGNAGVYYASVDGVRVTVVDEHTLSIRLREPNPAYLETLVWPVLPKHILEGVDPSRIRETSFSTNPVGTGAFSLSSISQGEIVVRTNDKYWGEKPKIDGIIFRLYESPEDAIAALNAGVIHAFCYYDLVPPEVTVPREVATGYLSLLPKRTYSMYFNLREAGGLVRNITVRQALSYALPKDKIVDEALLGDGQVAFGPIPSWSWAFNKKVNYYSYNLKKAKELIAKVEAEQKNVVLTYQEGPVRQQIAEMVKASWASIGVATELNPIEYKLVFQNEKIENALYQTILPGRDFEVLMLFQESSIDPDRYSHYHSTKTEFPGYNLSGYDEVRVDLDLENARKTADAEQRKQDYFEFQERLMEDVPVAFLFTPKITYWVSHRVSGVDLSGLVLPEDRFMSVSDWDIN